MRNCNDCQICCKGFLSGSTRGSWFGGLTPCKYLVDGCTIYSDRPTHCRSYQCAWSQGILPELMKPSELNMVVSVEIDSSGKQFLKVVYTGELSDEIEEELDNFVSKNDTYYLKTKIIPIKRIT